VECLGIRDLETCQRQRINAPTHQSAKRQIAKRQIAKGQSKVSDWVSHHVRE
jgi:hypothetical protein